MAKVDYSKYNYCATCKLKFPKPTMKCTCMQDLRLGPRNKKPSKTLMVKRQMSELIRAVGIGGVSILVSRLLGLGKKLETKDEFRTKYLPYLDADNRYEVVLP